MREFQRVRRIVTSIVTTIAIIASFSLVLTPTDETGGDPSNILSGLSEAELISMEIADGAQLSDGLSGGGSSGDAERHAATILGAVDDFLHRERPTPDATLVRTMIDGKKMFWDTPTRVISDRMLIPARLAADALGISVEWDPVSKNIGIISATASASFKVGSRKALINGLQTELPVSPISMDGVAFVPAAILSVFADVEWDNANRVVILRSGGFSAIQRASGNQAVVARAWQPQTAPDEDQQAQQVQDGLQALQDQQVQQDQQASLTIPVATESSAASDPIRVLMYHEIGDGPSTLYVREREFEAQMEYLYNNGYNVISMDDALRVLKGEMTVKKGVVVTFDDGYVSFYSKAWGILKKYGFTATVYTICGFAESDSNHLTWDEMRFLQANWMDVGSHTTWHVDLRNLGSDDLQAEIGASKAIIESELDYPCRHFCYPGGYYTKQATDLVKEAGFESAVTISSGFANASSDLYRLPRLFVRRGVTAEKLEKILRTGIT